MAVGQKSGGVTGWLLARKVQEVGGPESSRSEEEAKPWWQIVCLTGVDYFSTLGYIPGIALFAAGALSPIATLLIVLLTLFGMLPMYRRVATESPNGQGSIAMLERLLSFWKGKVFVLVLLGFVATAWLVTITLSAADATAHVVENPFVPEFVRGQRVLITLVLLALLGGIFLKGFREAIGVAVPVVAVFLTVNLIAVSVGFYEIFTTPGSLLSWRDALFAEAPNPLLMFAAAMLVFPQLALGLSGFETGVSMMPLVRGDPGDRPDHPTGRIRNTGKMLMVAALIMSFFLLTTSFVTAVLIPAEAAAEGGPANGRAMAYLAHEYLGDGFGTVYDVSTIAILWFAGASAMAGLLNIVPRYLPRYGMSPEWGRAVRPMVLVYTAVAFVVTIIFGASVDAQAGAYATGVLAMMTSAAVAVTLAAFRRGDRRMGLFFTVVSAVFVYALVANEVQRPDGLLIALLFIFAIVVLSLISRAARSTELRTERVELDDEARRFIREASESGALHIIAHRRRRGDSPGEYAEKQSEQHEDNHIPPGVMLFLEVDVADPSEFADVVEVRGVDIGGYRVLRAESSTVPNAIAALLLYLRDETGLRPHCYFGWTEGNPILYLLRYLLFGEGDTAPVCREVLREAEPDPKKRPAIHVGG